MATIEETVDEFLDYYDEEVPPVVSYGFSVSDGLTLDPDINGLWGFGPTIIDEFLVTPSWDTEMDYATTIEALLRLSVQQLKIYDLVTMTEGIEITPEIEEFRTTYQRVRERFIFDDDIDLLLTWQKTVLEAIEIAENLQITRPFIITEGMTFSDALRPYALYLVAEELGLTEQLAAKFTIGATIADVVTLADTLARYFGASLEEAMAIVDLVARKKQINNETSETIEITPEVSRGFYLSITAADGIEITPEQALQMQFRPTLTDALEIVSIYLDPTGGATTWAVTLSNGAVTEYTNYNFNSFAKIGNKYIAASSSGLYELNGDDDNGTDIISRLKSGLLSLGGSRFTAFKGVYLGVRGGGDYVLKLIDGNDTTYIYAIEARDMETTKVPVGKGLRSRYFAFELISTGQDFDLDSIEFLPLVSNRRV